MPRLEPSEITPHVYQCPIPIPNNPLENLLAYLVQTPEGTWMIDAGWNTPEAIAAWESHLAALDLSFEDITRIIITHLHPDHYGLAGTIRERSGASVAMSQVKADQITSRYRDYRRLLAEVGSWLSRNGVGQDELTDLQQVSLRVLDRVAPAQPEITLQEGDLLEAGFTTLQVIETPGHSPGHICLFARELGLLFAGDHVLPTISPHIGMYPQSPPNPLAVFFHSLDKVDGLKVNLVLPAHEYVFNNLRQRIRQIKEHHRIRLEEVLAALDEGEKTAYQVAAQVSWAIGPWEQLDVWARRSALMEVVAHLEYLLSLGRVEKRCQPDLVLYRRSQDRVKE